MANLCFISQLRGNKSCRVCVVNCSYSFMKNLWLQDVVGMYTVFLQALHGDIIRVLQVLVINFMKLR